MTDEEVYQLGIKLTSLKGIKTDKALELLGRFIDSAGTLKKLNGLKHAVRISALVEKRQLNSKQKTLLHYFTGNAWSGIRILSRGGKQSSWNWHQEEFENEIISLRLALHSDGIRDLEPKRFCQVTTNLGNAFHHIGRFVESLQYMNMALDKLPQFAMARANRGREYYEYARVLHQAGHGGESFYFLIAACEDLAISLKSNDYDFYRDARNSAEELLSDIKTILEKHTVEANALNRACFTLNSKDGAHYLDWCLRNTLFLNPLNDLGSFDVAVGDSLHLPSIRTKIGEPPNYFGLFNQLKMEYVTARNLYYEGTINPNSYVEDVASKIVLIDTLDYPLHSIGAEKIKIAYRVAYSIFDKIAFFINKYFALNIPEKNVFFKGVWHESDKKRVLRETFRVRENWPLRSLFWLSKDIYETNQIFKDSIEPDARELANIRNHLEHKYLKLHEVLVPPDRLFTDTDSYSITLIDFEKKALTVLKLARASILYLVFAISIEERAKGDERVPAVHLPTYKR